MTTTCEEPYLQNLVSSYCKTETQAILQTRNVFAAMYDDDDEPEGPKSSYTTYLSEGNVHFNQGEYKKALDSYTQVNDLS